METKKLHFETLQLHVGQEQPDPATDAAPYLSIRQLRMYFVIRPMRQPALACRTRGIFTGG